LPVPRPRPGSEPVHLPVDSTGLKLCGPGQRLVEKHATRTRWSLRKLYIGVDADTGQIIAAELISKDVDDGSPVGSLLEQTAGTLRRLLAMGRMIGTMSASEEVRGAIGLALGHGVDLRSTGGSLTGRAKAATVAPVLIW
jgi:hypothetical protein